jgi:hypothetical protein
MNELLNAQNTLNQMQLNQAKQQRKLWWQKNWWWVAGSVVLVSALGVITYKKMKK